MLARAEAAQNASCACRDAAFADVLQGRITAEWTRLQATLTVLRLQQATLDSHPMAVSLV